MLKCTAQNLLKLRRKLNLGNLGFYRVQGRPNNINIYIENTLVETILDSVEIGPKVWSYFGESEAIVKEKKSGIVSQKIYWTSKTKKLVINRFMPFDINKLPVYWLED